MEEFKLTDAAILDLIKQGTVIKKVKITDRITIELKNLTQDDREKYSKLIDLPKVKSNDKDNDKDKDKSKEETEEEINNTLYLLMEASKVPILVYAITKINDTDFSSLESKTTLHKLLLQLPPIFIDKAYNAYVENERSINAIFSDDSLKKN